MPNRKTHQAITLIASLPAIPVAISLLDFTQACSFMAGVYITLIPEFTPDLDINARHFGWLGEFMGLKAYSTLVPHRYGMREKHWSRLRIWNIFFLSHVPFLGTSLRTILLLIPLSIVLLLYQWWSPSLLTMLIFLWLGMSYSDIWHVVADNPFQNQETTREFWNRRRAFFDKSIGRKFRRQK